MTRKTLEELGLAKEAIDRIMTENGNDIESARKSEQTKFDTERKQLNGQIADLQGQITARDKDLTALNESLTAAKADAGKLSDVTAQLTALQGQYDTDRKAWEAKTAKQAYEFAVREEAGKLNFSSEAAHRDFVRGAIDKGFTMEDGKIIGLNDYIESYKAADPGAFAADDGKKDSDPGKDPAPKIVLPKNQKQTPDKSAFGFHFNGVRPMPKE